MKKPDNQYNPILCIIIIVICLQIIPGGCSAAQVSDNGTVLAVYMIGSTLEFDPDMPSNEGAASIDLANIVTGYDNGTSGLDVLIAYGGSLKPGWKGITIVTPAQLKDDLRDGMVNGSCTPLKKDENANMADSSTLTEYLTYIGMHSPGKRIILVFWDHGSAWKGFGYDDNYIDPKTNETDSLSLDELGIALKNAGNKYDLIGFDACLMANLDVLTTLVPYGDVFVGSEEIEPSFGWDWETILKNLVENPRIPTKELGTLIVNSYLDNPDHTSEPKTLSCIDIKKVSHISEKFNVFSSQLGERISNPDLMQSYSNAVLKVKAFGTYPLKSGEMYESSVDLVDYLTSIKHSNPTLTDEIDPILDSLNESIIIAREDGSRPNAKGISIYSPYMAILASQNKVDLPPKDLLTGFDDLLERFVGELRKDTRLIPNIIEDKNGYTIPENASVNVEITYIQNINNTLVILGNEPAYPDKPGHFPFPKWGGWGLQWKDSLSNTTLVVPVKYMGNTATGRERYESYGKVTRDGVTKNIRFDFYFEPHSGSVSYYITPYTITGTTTPVFDRKVWSMKPGDNLTMLATKKIQGANSERVDEYGSIIWTDDIDLGYGMLPCGYKYTVTFDVFDVTRKIVYQDYTDVDVPCMDLIQDEK